MTSLRIRDYARKSSLIYRDLHMLSVDPPKIVLAISKAGQIANTVLGQRRLECSHVLALLNLA